ncbi:MAG: ATP-grasp domain-containing protein [Patescibacteria group bacterium]
MKVALLCGGPSAERGISLNSARTVMDHLDGEGIEVVPVYFDLKKQAYLISKSWIYSNTPLDFDFKLKRTSSPLSEDRLIKELKKMDIVFPAMHGSFGEDGGIQRFLENNGIPFVGASSKTCKLAFDKFRANNFIREEGFFAPYSIDLSVKEGKEERVKKIKRFFSEHNIKKAIVKPAKGGSSIGVFSVETSEEAEVKARYLFSNKIDNRVVVEPLVEGKEFTAIIVESDSSVPVCILPTEIETGYTDNRLFDFRKKYLPTRQVSHHCPPRFSGEIIESIQEQAEQLFSLFGFHDVARFDGWVFPDGRLWFSDFNPVSGMEQNSFLFQQSSRIGFSHRGFLKYIIKNSCLRQGVKTPPDDEDGKKENRKRVNVLFGGKTSERQVSLMSGTNAWLKLRNSKKYDPHPYLLDTKGKVWQLPYAYTLNHTVEEIMENCEKAKEDQKRLLKLEKRVNEKLSLTKEEKSEEIFLPKKMSVSKFITESDFVFLGLHGGDGENGHLQEKMEKERVRFNGSGSHVSKIFMDKWRTGRLIKKMNIEGLGTTTGEMMSFDGIKERFREGGEREVRQSIWNEIKRSLNADKLIVKPRADGCSTGIVKLNSADELYKYIDHLIKGVEFIPPKEFFGQEDIVHMPAGKVDYLIFEEFIDTDTVRIRGDELIHKRKRGWVEITMGVLEKEGKIEALNPSITVAEGSVLTVEEKFQGGTGVNLTPPPEEIVKPSAIERAKSLVKEMTEDIGVEGYARVDAFMQIDSGDLKIIEVNTLPALTPSTVLYHQALAEDPPVFPTELLEMIVKNCGY